MAKVIKNSYTADDVEKLPFPENVRTRPEMYIGRTNKKGQLTCLREIVNNSVDEFLSGNCTVITVLRHSKKSFSVIDNGRGVPFDVNKQTGENALTMIFSELHAGRNFKKKEFYSTGLNGVGASCVNAMSSIFTVTSKRQNNYAVAVFESGIKTSLNIKKLKNISETMIKTETGTCVMFNLEDSLFEEELSDEEIIEFLKDVAYATQDLKINYKNLEANIDLSFCYKNKNSLVEFIKDNSKERKTKLIFEPVHFEDTINETKICISFSYEDKNFESDNIVSFCNTIRTQQNGSHVTGFKRSLSQNFMKFIKDNNMTKVPIENDDTRCGLVAVVSVFSFDPKYTNQMKQELDMNDVMGFVIKACNNFIKDWLSANGKLVKQLVNIFELAAKGRLAQKKALENVKKEAGTFISSMSDLKKFGDCLEHGKDSELFLVEGDSAAGPCNQSRNKVNQAVYALKGKIMNVKGNSIEKIQANKEISDIRTILKCGEGDSLSIDKCQFGKIIILSDADQDGAHIQNLILTLKNTSYKPLLEAGMIYVALPPLYRATKNNSKPVYLKDEKALNEFYLKELENNFSFKNNNKVLSSKIKLKFIGMIREYYNKTQKFCYNHNIDSHVFELSCVNTFNGENWNHSKDFSFEVDNDKVFMNGFVQVKNGKTIEEEYFFSLNNIDLQILFDFCSELLSLKEEIENMKVDIFYKEKEFTSSTLIKLFKYMESVSQSFQVTRFKGLGEANADELVGLCIKPETRNILQVTCGENDDLIVNELMGKETEFKKEIIMEAFNKELDVESLDLHS